MNVTKAYVPPGQVHHVFGRQIKCRLNENVWEFKRLKGRNKHNTTIFQQSKYSSNKLLYNRMITHKVLETSRPFFFWPYLQLMLLLSQCCFKFQWTQWHSIRVWSQLSPAFVLQPYKRYITVPMQSAHQYEWPNWRRTKKTRQKKPLNWYRQRNTASNEKKKL